MGYRVHRSTHTLESHLAAGANHGLRYLTAKDGDSLAQNVPLIYDANGNVISTATRTGNTTNYVTATAGSKTSGNYPKWDANGNLTDGDTGGGGGGGSDLIAPPTTGWTWFNTTHNVSTASGNSLYLSDAATTQGNYLRSAASAPWSLAMGHRVIAFGVNWPHGLMLRNSSSDKRYSFFYFNNDVYVQTHTGGTFNSTKVGPLTVSFGQVGLAAFMFCVDDNTDLKFYVGINRHIADAHLIFSEARGTWAVPDQYGLLFGGITAARGFECVSWEEF